MTLDEAKTVLQAFDREVERLAFLPVTPRQCSPSAMLRGVLADSLMSVVLREEMGKE
jgi:hypothetical protein